MGALSYHGQVTIRIPKIIHHIWIGSDLPAEFAEFRRTWQKHHPDWEMILWTDDNMPRLTNQALYDAAETIHVSRMVPRFRSDLARLEILAEHGGLYLDTDFMCCRSIEPLINDLDLFACEEKPGLIANGLIGSVPGHQFIKDMIRGVPAAVRRRPREAPWRQVGPLYLTEMSNRSPGVLGLLPTDMIYPYHHTHLLADGSPPPIPDDVVCHHVWASIRRSVSIILPFRAGCRYREQNRDWVVAYYRKYFPTWQLIEVDSDGDTFSKAEAIRRGVAQSFGDVLVIADADLILTNLRAAVGAVVRHNAQWAIPHGNVHRLAWDATRKVLQGTDPRQVADRTAERLYWGLPGGGAVVIDRETFEACPPDPRFRGWGGEDEAWGLALNTLAGSPWRNGGQLLHLWHPPAARMARAMGNTANEALVARYRSVKNSRSDMEKLVAEHREV